MNRFHIKRLTYLANSIYDNDISLPLHFISLSLQKNILELLLRTLDLKIDAEYGKLIKPNVFHINYKL